MGPARTFQSAAAIADERVLARARVLLGAAFVVAEYLWHDHCFWTSHVRIAAS